MQGAEFPCADRPAGGHTPAPSVCRTQSNHGEGRQTKGIMKTSIDKLKFPEFANLYCERQVNNPEGLKITLLDQANRLKPDGWVILECVVMDSSRFGSRTILPFGENCTLKVCPTEGVPISPRGLASDMSLPIAILEAKDLQ